MITKKHEWRSFEQEIVPSFLQTPLPTRRGPALPQDATARKRVPIVSGVLDYFPDAIAAVAECSRVGNEQHNPGTPLHWDRAKSGDEADALGRHLIERGTVDSDGIRHSAKLAWRALALLQKEVEGEMKTDTHRAATFGSFIDEEDTTHGS